MNHQRRPPGMLEAYVIRLRRGVGQTRGGRVLKRLVGREVRLPSPSEPQAEALVVRPGERSLPVEITDAMLLQDAVAWRRQALQVADPTTSRFLVGPVSAPKERRIANVLFVSHCDFTGNSALHVYAIAMELHRRGYSPAIAVPDGVESVDDVGPPPFPVLTYDEATVGRLAFPDGRGPDLVHAFTPRELVRKATVELVRAYGCPYVLHLEDNDEVVLSGELGGADIDSLRALPLPVLDRIIQPRQSHPLRSARFAECAAGMTVLVDSLSELVPKGVPAVLMRAGFDEAVLEPTRPREEVRAGLRLAPADIAIVYPGNVHSLNRDDMRDLYSAVADLRRSGRPVVLVKTGWGSGVAATFPSLGAGIRDLGWVPRGSIPDLIAAADILVQPGGPGPFNDYRFPSKLPEFLASGRPVVLPRTNIGLELRDGEEALLLDRGDPAEIVAAVERLVDDPELRERLGAAGRSFALRELRWSSSVDQLEELLAVIAASPRPVAPAWRLEGADPPAKLIAYVRELPSDEEGENARSHGVFGFCLDARTMLEPPGRLPLRYPFCAVLGAADREVLRAASGWFASPGYIRIGGVPLVLVTEGGEVERLRASLENEAGEPLHLALVARAAQVGVDSTVEKLPDADADYQASFLRRLAERLPDDWWFRSLAPPRSQADSSLYAVWLRKLVLQTALRAGAQAPFLFVDASREWSQPADQASWLAATRSGMRDGIAQYYASRRLPVDGEDLDAILRAL